jgi:dinuclear metal center YbgI/SA1388 family protein
MHIGAFMEEMERIAPLDLAEEFDRDRIGLVVEGRTSIHRICCALDATPAVVQQAIGLRADMLVVHHTPIWNPVTRVTGSTANLMRLLLAADMNLYVMHTNFDHAEGGVNDALCNVLSLTEIRPLVLGRIGTCALSPAGISERLSCGLRIWGELRSVSCLAVVAGSGFDLALMDEAKSRGADAFLSAEMKHAVARSAPLPCIEATHYALEAPAMRELAIVRGWDYIDDPPSIRSVP